VKVQHERQVVELVGGFVNAGNNMGWTALLFSGGDKYPILPFPVEISYRCFTGCQKNFGDPAKSPYENSPVKVYFAHLSPPDALRRAVRVPGDLPPASGREK
jgi:hypothetical protein